jgi:hypothetical protein
MQIPTKIGAIGAHLRQVKLLATLSLLEYKG